MAANESQVPVLEIAHVLFMDIVSYSKLPMDEQQRVLRQLQHAVRDTGEFQRADREDQLIRLPTGDGMALVFFGDPAAPARCALALSRILHSFTDVKLRMGIHSGPVYRLADINANRNVSGGGINLAQRVMDCGDAGHILVSSAVAGVLNEIGGWSEALHELGEAEVKHGVRVHVFNLYTQDAGNSERPNRLLQEKAPKPAVIPASPVLDSIVGLTLGPYRVLRRLDGGGMGILYEAEDLRLGRHVALKFLSDHLLHDASALARFRREATLASSLNHPNICTLFDIGEHQGRSFLVLELLRGSSLSDRLKSRSISLSDLLEWGIQVADALHVAHSSGIVHRDIKPGNIFITEAGIAKILDFGLAKLSSAGGELASPAAKLTVAGVPLGTVAYMSPEQARGEELDGGSDIFSLGAVLYEMATGRVPFEGNTSAVVFDAILNRAPTAPVTLTRGLPVELQLVINHALEKDRARRYHSAAELSDDLKRLRLRQQPRGSARPERVPIMRLPRSWAAAAFSLVAVLILATGVISWLRSRPSPGPAPAIANAVPSPAGVSTTQPGTRNATPARLPDAPAKPAITAAAEPRKPANSTKKGTAENDLTPAASKLPSSPASRIAGRYAGNIRTTASAPDVPARALLLEEAGVVTGCLIFSPPLRGSGPLRGVSQGDLVVATVYFSTGRTELQGQIAGEELTGKYVVTDGGKRQQGTFFLQKTSKLEPAAASEAGNCRTD